MAGVTTWSRTLAECAVALRELDDEWRLRVLLHEFGLTWNDAPIERRLELVAEEPVMVDDRWDALLAAYAEHLCWHAGLPAPHWALDEGRVLAKPWFVAGWSPTLKVEAIVHSPASFEARGVLISDRELAVV